MSDWIALSDRHDPPYTGGDSAILERGLFVLEFVTPLDRPTVLLDHQAADGWPRTFSIFADQNSGVTLLHRQGGSVARHVLTGPLPSRVGVARIALRFDAPKRHWQMSCESLDGSATLQSEGTNPLPLQLSDLRALCMGPTIRHGSVLWYGATQGAAPPDRAPWIGPRTPISTDRGLVAAGALKIGDRISTLDDGFLPLQSLRRMELPSRGSFAPVLLRAPYFGAKRDILVSSDQLVLISGAEVEYLFGEEEVLLPAADLIDDRVALSENRRSVTASIALDLGGPALISADGCALMSATNGPDPGWQSPRRVLQGYETHPLMALMGRTTLRRVA